jgi:hypothetical protein
VFQLLPGENLSLAPIWISRSGWLQ